MQFSVDFKMVPPCSGNFTNCTMKNDSGCITSPTTDSLFHNANFLVLWVCAIPLVIICLLTLVANGAIICMFATRAKVRKCRNTYILSLAVANFLLGLTLPFSIVETLGEEWIFGADLCIAFLTVRYSLFYVTILSIILITVDRWWSINFPFSYRIRRSRKKAFILAALIWIISFVIHIPSIVGWNILHTGHKGTHKFCRVPYENNAGFTISASLIEFFIPLTLLLSLNTGIYIKLAKRRNSKKIRRSLSTSDGHVEYRRKTSSDSENNNSSDEKADIVTSLTPLKSLGRNSTSSIVTAINRMSVDRRSSGCVLPPINQRVLYSKRYSGVRRLSNEYASLVAAIQRTHSISKTTRTSITSKTTKQHDAMVRDFLLRQDNKALFSLALLVLTFVFCWTPAVLCDILYSLCPGDVPMWVVQLCNWVLTLSSCLNPFLYGIGNTDFRRVAKSWFCAEPSNSRVLENLLYSQLIQPCDIVALKDVDVIENRRISGSGQMSYV